MATGNVVMRVCAIVVQPRGGDTWRAYCGRHGALADPRTDYGEACRDARDHARP